LWGGFSDGTLRVWDLSGTFGVEDDDVVASRQKTDVMVNSKLTQGYGAVACQIHARGVHTDLITTVDISDDSQYVFVGVARGAMELHAVYIGDLERAVHTHKQREREQKGSKNRIAKRNILDYIKVYCHSDAKIKGFGACATMRVAKTTEGNNTSSSSYLLLTGKGIKNIHIWKFTPPQHTGNDELMEEMYGRNRKQSICDPPDDEEDHGIWDQLYDTATNGNTIVLLGFYRNPQNKLLAVSKSDTQKLRLWDLSFEEDSNLSDAAKDDQRPKRPPYKDVVNSQSALETAGGIGVCGGGNMYNEMSIVSLDRPDDPYNHTELALPSAAALSGADAAQQQFMGYSSRRQRRGEMKAVVNVATSPRDSSHALLELDDGSLVGFSAGSSSSTKDSSGSIPKLAIATPESTGIPALPADFWRRCICLANIAGVVIAGSSLYNPNTNKGQLVIRALGGLKKPRGSEIAEKKKLKKQKRMERERLELERLEKERLKQEREQVRQARLPKTDEAPKTPSPIHTNPQSSPIAADTNALRDAVSAPAAIPVSVLRSNKKKSLNSQAEDNDGSNKNSTQPLTSSSATLTRVSPNGTMETPRRQKSMQSEEDDSPESTQGLPKISKFLQPKRINLPAKRKAEETVKNETQTSSEFETPTTTGKTSNSQNSMFQLNSIGSIPFKSPKPHAKKQRKVGAPSKPKKVSSVPPIPFSTPEVSRDIPERKRDRDITENGNPIGTSQKVARTSEDVSTALLLTELASPKSTVIAKGKTVDGSSTPKTIGLIEKAKAVAKGTSKTKAQGDSNRMKLISSAGAVKKPSSSTAKSKGKETSLSNASIGPQQPTREEILHEKISEQYQQLRAFLKTISARSMELIHSRNMRGPAPSALASEPAQSDATHLSAYSKLLAEHKAAHNYLQRRLLRSAETTLSLLLESRITAEEARTELKHSIKKFEEILYDTLRRQEMERLALVAQHHGNPKYFARSRKSGNDSEKSSESKKENAYYPCKEAFDKVEDICAAITRPVGRPRSAIAALR